VRKRTVTRKNHSPLGSRRPSSGWRPGLGAFGALAIRALAIKRGRIERRELTVEQEQTPRQATSGSTS
jgi:hypothetical protein